MNVNQDQMFSALKKDVRSLLVSAKFGLVPDQLKRDYQALVGHPLPLRVLGFRHVLDMVREMPDVVYVDYDRDGSMKLKAVVDETTRGIRELVAKQRTPKARPSPQRTPVRSFGSSRMYHPKVNSLIMPRRVTGPPPLPAHLRSQFRQLLSQGPLRLSELERHYTLRFGRRLQPECCGYYSLAEMLSASTDLITIEQSRSGSLVRLKTCVTQPPRPVTPHHNTGAPKQQVSSSVNRPSASLVSKESKPKIDKPDVELTVDCQSFEKSVSKLEEQLRQQILEVGDAGTVSPALKAKLQQIMDENPSGVPLHQLPLVYKKMFGEDLPLVESGFVSVSELVGAASDVLCVKPNSKEETGHLMVTQASDIGDSEKGHYLSSEDSPWDRTTEQDAADGLHAERKVNKTIQQVEELVPVDSVVPLDAVQNQKLKAPTRHKERELLPVLVERVESPGHFYVRFEGQESRRLEDMMLQMRTFYACPEMSQRYRLLEGFVRPGQLCCVAPRDIWFYRVIILQVLDSQQVEVYYVDFGDVNTVDVDRLCFLKACYTTLPAQAVPSSLSGIKPVGNHTPDKIIYHHINGSRLITTQACWTASASVCFQRFCCNRLLVAAIDGYRGGFLQLFLCDTHTQEDVYVHSTLQAEGHAEPCAKAEYLETLFKSNPVSLYMGDGELQPVKLPEPSVEETHGLSKPVTSDSEKSSQPVTEAKLPMEEPAPLPNIPVLESTPLPDVHILESAPLFDVPTLESAPLHDVPTLESAPLPDVPVVEAATPAATPTVEATALTDIPKMDSANITEDELQAKVNPFEALLCKDVLISSEWDRGWNPDGDDTAEKSSLEIANHDRVPKLESLPDQLPFLESRPVEVSSPRTQSSPQDAPTPAPSTPSAAPTLQLKQGDICSTGVEASTPGLFFPILNPEGRISPDKLFLHHASPLALRPASRMAAGLNFLKW